MDNHEELVASCVLYAFYSEVEHMDRDSDSFMHWGRIGMKWGQHIFGDDTRYGRMKKAASKAADSLRGLEVYGDKMREGVARFKTQTRAEANRWRMDNGYQKDSYKEYHAEKARKQYETWQKQNKTYSRNMSTWGDIVTGKSLVDSVNYFCKSAGLDNHFGERDRAYDTLKSDLFSACGSVLAHTFRNKSVLTADSTRDTISYLSDSYKKASDKLKRYRKDLGNPKEGWAAGLMKQMETCTAAMGIEAMTMFNGALDNDWLSKSDINSLQSHVEYVFPDNELAYLGRRY